MSAMTITVMNLLAVSLLVSAAACAGTARAPEAYRTDTNNLLETRSAQLESCYQDALKTDAKLAGTVTVQFMVEKQTGAIANAAGEQDKTTAPPILGQCVV